MSGADGERFFGHVYLVFCKRRRDPDLVEILTGGSLSEHYRDTRSRMDSRSSVLFGVRFTKLAVLAASALTAGVFMLRAQAPRAAENTVGGRPIQVTSDAYVSSDTCRACHPAEYASWRASYHRTMTQVATIDAVRADFDHVLVSDVPGNPI